MPTDIRGQAVARKSKTHVLPEMATERTDLGLHVDLCTERYDQLVTRLDSMDARFDRIESMIVEIKQTITDNQSSTLNRYLIWAGVIIAALMSLSAGLLLHLAR